MNANMKSKFLILSPRQKWGGSIVLHALAKYLNELGYDARIFYTETYDARNLFLFYLKLCYFDIKDLLKTLAVKLFPQSFIELYKSTFLGYINTAVDFNKRKFIPFVTSDTIVIYPDTVYGNPLHAKKVVRWFLYHNRYKDAPSAYGEKDLFVCYRKQFNDEVLNPNEYELQTPYFNLDLYKRTNYGERHGTCYIIRKGKTRDDLPKSFDGPIIDKLSEDQKVEIFNKCERCILYDTQTAYSGIAAMCGCLSIVVPEKGKKRSDYLSNGELGYGRAYGYTEEEIEFAKKTSYLVEESYKNSNQKGKESVKQFIELCEKYFYE